MDAGLLFVAYELGWQYLDDDKIDLYVDRFGEFLDMGDEPEIAVINSREEEIEWGESFKTRKVRRLRKYFLGIGVEMFWENSIQIDSPEVVEKISLARDILVQTLGEEFQSEPGIYLKGPR